MKRLVLISLFVVGTTSISFSQSSQKMVYIYRPSIGMYGSLIKIKLNVNGTTVKLSPGTYTEIPIHENTVSIQFLNKRFRKHRNNVAAVAQDNNYFAVFPFLQAKPVRDLLKIVPVCQECFEKGKAKAKKVIALNS